MNPATSVTTIATTAVPAVTPTAVGEGSAGRRSSFLKYLADHNPFYLLSAVCMLAGCLALTNSFSGASIPLRRLLILMATLNVYEFLLIGLGLLLVLRRRLVKDAVMLLIVQAVFLVDITFLNSELFTTSLRWGAAANLLQLVLAGVKVGLVVSVLGLAFGRWTYVLVMIQMAVLLGLGGWCRWTSDLNDGWLPMWSQYAAWWLAGAVPVLIVARPIFASPSTSAIAAGPLGPRAGMALAWAYVALPAVSVLLHLPADSWVYKSTFYWGNAAPVLLGLAVVCGRCQLRGITRRPLLGWQTALIVLAVLMSAAFPRGLALGIGSGEGWLILTPWRLVLMAGALVWLDSAWLHRRIWMVCGAAACGLGALAGPSGPGVITNVLWTLVGAKQSTVHASHHTASFARRLIPTTAFGWGVVSVSASFVLLAMGAVLSLLKGSHPAKEERPVEVVVG